MDFSCDEAHSLSTALEVASADAKNEEENITSYKNITINQGLSKFQTYGMMFSC